MSHFVELFPSDVIPELGKLMEKHSFRVVAVDASVFKKFGAMFNPAGELEGEPYSAFLIVPPRWSKKAQTDMAHKIYGYFHALKVIAHRNEMGQKAS